MITANNIISSVSISPFPVPIVYKAEDVSVHGEDDEIDQFVYPLVL